jgi:6-phosphofructokinase
MKIGILTSGGDCPGLNAVIRSVGKYVFSQIKDVTLYGIANGYGGLITGDYRKMKESDFSGILNMGGTILGTSRQPFSEMTGNGEDDEPSKLDRMLENYKKMELDLLFTLGGNGTHKTSALLSEQGCHVIGVPKTIDNDIWGTDVTFGFNSAVNVASWCIDNVHTTAASHGRTILVEIMGNRVGWLTLYSGIAGGADVILIPEMPYDTPWVIEKILGRAKAGKDFSIIAIAEGAMDTDEAAMKRTDMLAERAKYGYSTATERLAETITKETGIETRTLVPGHLQRGGNPTAYDRVLSTMLGTFAGKLAKQGTSGVTVAIKNNSVAYNLLSDVAGKTKYVPLDHPLIDTARSIGVSFGQKR